MKSTTRGLLLSSVALMLAPTVAQAQVAGQPPAGASANATSVQEIVVTSPKRSVNLQKVPGTVTALPADTLKSMNINGTLGLAHLTPGLVITPAGGNNVYLRGIGSSSTGYNEAQVATYLDGIYLANPAMGIYSFNNIDQVEVLKGPQGTLYGRNATGGLISVTTRDPGAQPQFDASLGYANYNTDTETVYASMPINENLAANFSYYHSKQNEGWSTNIFNNTQEQRSQETGVQSKIVWHPTSSTKITTNFVYDENNRDLGYASEVLPGTVANDGTVFNGKYKTDSRVDPSSPFSAYIGSVKIDQDLGFASFSSLTAYQSSNETTLFSPAAGPGLPKAGEAAAVDNFIQASRTWSQEFQLTSKPSSSRLDWIVGAYYYNNWENLDLQTWTTCVAGVCAPGTPLNTDGVPTIKSYAGYGDINYRLFDATHLTIGLRYTDETDGLSGRVTPLAGFPTSVTTLPASTVLYPGGTSTTFPVGIPTSLHFDKLTYRFVLAQDFGDNIHAYVSDNLGFKAGAYNADAFTNIPALPETLDAYEVGVKSELLDRRLRLNVSIFHYDYTNVQVRSTAPPALPGNSILENAAAEKQNGADLDFSFVVTPGLTINGGYEWLDSKYTNFPGTSCTTPATKVVGGVTLGAPISVPCNLAGYTTPFSPPGSGNIGFIYKIDSSIGSWALAANNAYNSSYSMVTDNSVRQASHNIVDASLLWTAPSKKFDVRLWGRNLTEQYTYVTAFANGGGSYYITPGAPRTFGATVSYHY